MRNLLKLIVVSILVLLTLGVTGCSVSTSENINVDANQTVYDKDTRTGLCFGYIASSRALAFESSGLGMTCVPCDSVEHLIK